MDRSHGYQFTVDLSEAVGDAVALAGPGAFAYRGADLSHAVERQLFTKLVNDHSVYAAFEQAQSGGRVQLPAVTSMLDQHVVGLLLAPTRRAPAALKASARLLAWRRRPPRAGAPPDRPGAIGPIAYLLDHPKFLRFVDPLLAGRAPGDAVMLSTVEQLTEDLRSAGLAHRHLDYGREVGPASPSELGPGLRERDRLAMAFDVLTQALQELQPRCLVAIEGNSAFDEVGNRAARALGIPTVCLQQGWSPIVHSGFRNLSFTRMAVWGDGFLRLLAPYNPAQRFDVTGNPSFAAEATGSGEKRRSVAFFLQSTSSVISENHLLALQSLVRRAARHFAGVPVLVREHPGSPLSRTEREELQRLPNVSLVPSATYSLREVIQQSRVAVSIYSTALLECAALMTPPVVFNPTSMPRSSPDVEAFGAGVETRTAEEALDALHQIVTDDAYHASFFAGMARVREEFFAGADAEAAERILAVIRSCSNLN